MNSILFDLLFARAVDNHGAEYLEAREGILALPSPDLVDARLEVLSRADGSWQQQLVATILRNWMEHRDLFERATAYLHDPLPGPRPVTGFSPAVRGKAIASLGPVIASRVIEMLWKAPEYRNENELGSLLSALIYLKDRRAVPPLLALLDASDSPPLRRGAIKVLSEIGDARSLDVLWRLAQDSKDASVRVTAIAGLGGFADDVATRAGRCNSPSFFLLVRSALPRISDCSRT